MYAKDYTARASEMLEARLTGQPTPSPEPVAPALVTVAPALVTVAPKLTEYLMTNAKPSKSLDTRAANDVERVSHSLGQTLLAFRQFVFINGTTEQVKKVDQMTINIAWLVRRAVEATPRLMQPVEVGQQQPEQQELINQ